MDTPSDDPFLVRLRSRDELAFNELVRTYERRVFGIVFRMLGNRQEAEDLTQEVFVQVFKAIHQFRGESKLSTWVFRIAVNLCKNRSKYLDRRHTKSQDDLDGLQEKESMGRARGTTSGSMDQPDDALQGKQMEYFVRECIAHLEEDFRECLILRDVEGMSYEEIGEIANLPAGTVKSRIHRARSQLRECLESKLGEKVG